MTTARTVLVSVLILGAVSLAGCQAQDDAEVSTPAASPDAAAVQEPVFGDGSPDNSRVLATVDGYPITETMLQMRWEELDRQEQIRYEDPEGRRLLLRRMVDEVLRVQQARQLELHKDPVVRRVLIAQEREALDLAMNNAIIADREPTIDEVREYFADHREDYKRLGLMHALHVQVATREEADEVYRRATEDRVAFARLVAEYTENADTRATEGSLGWFNRGGFIPGFRDSKGFTEAIWDLEIGVNPPVEFAGSWHVVKVVDRKYERLQTLEEAYDRVVMDMMADFRSDLVEQWMRDQRAQASIEYHGEFRPGHGKTAEQLFERAFYAKDAQTRLDLLGLLVDDYPESEYADDALFTAGNIALDTWGDRSQTSFFFNELIERYPDSDYVDDARYILDHMNDPSFVNPTSIEDLRRGGN